MVAHILQIVRSTPEVATTSRRTGLQLGLAAVTEANIGDISADLKTIESRHLDDHGRNPAEGQKSRTAVDVEFTQKLQDMIGDLTSAPQPIES